MTLSGFTKPICVVREPVPKAHQRAILEYKIKQLSNTSSTPMVSPSEWCAAITYPVGSDVLYKCHKWTANKSNYNEAPGGKSGTWSDDGPYKCSGCASILPWQKDFAYKCGNIVSYNGRRWVAKWWSYNERPSKNDGNAWDERGPC
ncbi:hypothetical protein OPQ81_008219 [Rhizoctonia solani]|nr:hypothetical protein OPQ81_008219 [Rhizoctonia solani]